MPEIWKHLYTYLHPSDKTSYKLYYTLPWIRQFLSIVIMDVEIIMVKALPYAYLFKLQADKIDLGCHLHSVSFGRDYVNHAHLSRLTVFFFFYFGLPLWLYSHTLLPLFIFHLVCKVQENFFTPHRFNANNKWLMHIIATGSKDAKEMFSSQAWHTVHKTGIILLLHNYFCQPNTKAQNGQAKTILCEIWMQRIVYLHGVLKMHAINSGACSWRKLRQKVYINTDPQMRMFLIHRVCWKYRIQKYSSFFDKKTVYLKFFANLESYYNRAWPKTLHNQIIFSTAGTAF